MHSATAARCYVKLELLKESRIGGTSYKKQNRNAKNEVDNAHGRRPRPATKQAQSLPKMDYIMTSSEPILGISPLQASHWRDDSRLANIYSIAHDRPAGLIHFSGTQQPRTNSSYPICLHSRWSEIGGHPPSLAYNILRIVIGCIKGMSACNKSYVSQRWMCRIYIE